MLTIIVYFFRGCDMLRSPPFLQPQLGLPAFKVHGEDPGVLGVLRRGLGLNGFLHDHHLLFRLLNDLDSGKLVGKIFKETFNSAKSKNMALPCGGFLK